MSPLRSAIPEVRHEALAAVDREDNSIVGVARYVMWPERAGAADVAIEVADDLHKRGVGVPCTVQRGN